MVNYAITCKNLSKIFRSPGQAPIKILTDISFQLRKGAKLAVTGGNGSGKTTLLKVLSTLYLPDEGDCKILDLDLRKQTREIQERVVFVSAGLDFQRKLTLEENLNFFAKVQNSSTEDAYKFIQDMNMTHIIDKRAETFSEGQKAITRLAIGLMKERSEILFLDEVTLGLDVNRKEEVLEYLSNKVQNKTLLIVDHDSNVIERLCSEILILKPGGISNQTISIKELTESLPYSYEINAIPKRSLTDHELREIWPHYIKTGSIIKFYPNDTNQAQRVTNRLIRSGLVNNIQTRKIDLNDLAIKMSEPITLAEEL